MKRVTPERVITLSILLGLLTITILLFSVTMGSVDVPLSHTLRIFSRPLFGSEPVDPTEETILLSLRLPRTILAGLVGSGLSLSGVIFQALLRNPLADPYILGVSSGSALGAIVAILLGLGTASFALPLSSFAGALLTVGVVFYFGRQNGKIHPNTLLLAGVVTGSFLSALIMFFLSIGQREELRTILFWLMGDLSFSNFRAIGVITPYLVCGFVILYRHARQLNLLLAGEENALHMGVNLERLRWVSYLAASLITAASVSVCGLIGFVGLMVPHLVRLLLGPDHRVLLPASALVGASFLMVADAVARTLLAPVELPVGVITAALGGPFFIYLLKTRRVIKTL